MKKIKRAIICMMLLSLFISVFSTECAAQNIPGVPTDFTATAINTTRIDLSWTKGDKADTTYIERNTESPWSIGEGLPIYNDTGTSYHDIGLSQNSHYYYQAWSWNKTDYIINSTYAEADNTTFANQPPFFGTPSPTNGSTSRPISFSWNISINDPEGDVFNWTIQCSNGQTNSDTGATNGSKTLALNELAYLTTYIVWVNATDPSGSGVYTRRWYRFTTTQQLQPPPGNNSPPVFGLPSPTNKSIDQPLSFSWSIPINDPEGDVFNWTIQCSNGQTNSDTGATNGSKTLALNELAYLTTYIVWVNATDPGGSGLHTREWYNFTTKANFPPVFGAPSPSNGSTSQPLSFSWSIPINDPEGDLFSWWIQCSNGQSSNGAGASNGTKALTLSGLGYSTTYKVWVNATDQTGSGLYTRRWYTFTTLAQNSPPVFGSPTPANGSTSQPLSLTWGIPINDSEGNTFSWTIQCNNGQTNSGAGASNGTKALTLSGLSYSKTYKIWVNATDPTGSNLFTKKWYRFTTESSGGGQPPPPPPGPQNKKPIANASADEPYHGVVNSEITFDGSRSYDPDGNITKWLWVFGDNTTGNGKTIRHLYLKAGIYIVTLIVTDNEGATDIDTTTCIVSQINYSPLTKPIITGPTNGKKNIMYTYTALATHGSNNPISYNFSWGDSISSPQSSGFLPNGSSFTVSHRWTAAGRYKINVTVTDNQSVTSSNITIYIDAIQTADIGYLLDNDGDGKYDAFYSDILKQTTPVQNKNGVYVIDSDGNGVWDYTFDKTNGLMSYQPRKTPGFDIILIICAIALILFWRKNGKKRV